MLGLNRLGITNDTIEAYWSYPRRSTHLAVGSWTSYQPNVSGGDCTSVTTSPQLCYRWALQPCFQRKPFVCQAGACTQSNYQ